MLLAYVAAAKILPNGLMMDAMAEFIAVGDGAPFPTVNFAGLVAMSVVLMPLGVHRLKKQVVP